MPIGAEIAQPTHPWYAKFGFGKKCIDLAAAPPRGHDARWRDCGWLWARGTAGFTGVAVRLGGEARKGCGLTLALWQ